MTSTTPTASIAWCAVPGIRLSIWGARYCSQSVSSPTNLSSPNRIGATVNTVRSNRKAWWAAGEGASVDGAVVSRWVVMGSSEPLKDSILDVRVFQVLRHR